MHKVREIMTGCSLVCVTCDLYSKLIPGFCHFLREGWPDCLWDLEIVAGHEQPWFEGLPYRRFWYYGLDKLWASNMLAYLQDTQAKIIILVLDDYYFLERVNSTVLVSLVDTVRADESIGYINLRPWTDDVLDGVKWEDWQAAVPDKPLVGEYDKATAEYLLSLQPGLWRTDFLASLLVEGEDHWATEIEGTKRARSADRRMLGVVQSFPMPYLNVTRYGIYRDGSREVLAGRLGEGHEILALLDDMLKERIRGCW